MKKIFIVLMLLFTSLVTLNFSGSNAHEGYVVEDWPVFVEEFDIDLPNEYLQNEHIGELIQILVDDSFRYPKDSYPYKYRQE